MGSGEAFPQGGQRQGLRSRGGKEAKCLVGGVLSEATLWGASQRSKGQKHQETPEWRHEQGRWWNKMASPPGLLNGVLATW